MPRLIRVLGPAVMLAAASVALLVALAIGGAAAAPAIYDPGPLVRFGLPFAKLLLDLGAAGTFGSLALVLFALSSDRKEYAVALDVAAGSAAVWTVAAGATTFLTFLDLSGQQLSLDPSFGQILGSFLSEIQVGQYWLFATIVPAVVTVLCFAVRNTSALAWVLILAGVGLVPHALMGHAAGSAGHAAAVGSLGLHLVFACVWLGGLLTLVFLKRVLDTSRLATVLERYSSLALLSFIIVAISGVANAALRVGSPGALFGTGYGQLVILKALALGGLGIFGAVYRTRIIARLKDAATARAFWLLAVVELAVMGVAMGVAAGLARTATPVPQEPWDSTPASLLTGEPLPPELHWWRLFTEWRIDPLWLVVCGILAFFYLAGVWRLHRRGDKWPVHRTVLWVTGVVLLFYVTSGGLNVYEKYLFSVHMLAHMLLGMAIPIFLAPAAPITLALRTIRKRFDGSRGMREWIMLFVHSRVAAIYANPIVAAVIFAGSLWLFYYTPIFRWALEEHIGHTLMIVHFLGSGYLFVQALIGVDPAPYRAPYPMRLLVLLGTMAFHAFFGLSFITATGLMVADWYGAMGRAWGPTAMADQQAAGGIAWSIGELPTVTLAIVIAIMWSRSDDKEARRIDRKADRDGDADLAAYNEMLARRSGQ